MLQALLDGAFAGLNHALVGLAFLLLLSSARLLCVGLGALYVLCPYLLLAGLNAGLPLPVAVLLAFAGCVALGLAQEELVHWPLERRRAPSGVQLVASLGVYLLLAQAAPVLWGPDPQVLQSGVPHVHRFGELRLTHPQVWGAVAAGLSLALVGVFMSRSGVGLSLRALADDPRLYSTTGRSPRQARRALFALTALLVSVPALASAWDLSFQPTVGIGAVLVGFAVALLAGDISVRRVLVAGLFVGIFRASVTWLSSDKWQDAATFALLALLLLPWPNGVASLTSGVRRVEELA